MKKSIIRIVLFISLVLAFASCTNYGTEKNYNGVQLFYTSEIAESLADSLGQFLIDAEFADGQTKTVQITKFEKTYQFRMVVKKGIEQDQEYCDYAKDFGALLSLSLFDGSPVDVHFCDESLETLKVIPMSDISDLMQDETFNGMGTDDYSISYPESWEVDESGQMGTDFILLSPQESESDMFRENINLLVQDLSGQSIDLEQYTQISTEQIQTLITDAKIISNSTIELANYPAQKLVYTGKQGTLDLYFIQYYWVQNEKAYVLTATLSSDSYTDYLDIVNKITETFELTL